MQIAHSQSVIDWEAAAVAVRAAAAHAQTMGIRINVAVVDAGGTLAAFFAHAGCTPALGRYCH
jgi:uncharacterized protein GlcG (DUF336 family)